MLDVIVKRNLPTLPACLTPYSEIEAKDKKAEKVAGEGDIHWDKDTRAVLILDTPAIKLGLMADSRTTWADP